MDLSAVPSQPQPCPRVVKHTHRSLPAAHPALPKPPAVAITGPGPTTVANVAAACPTPLFITGGIQRPLYGEGYQTDKDMDREETALDIGMLKTFRAIEGRGSSSEGGRLWTTQTKPRTGVEDRKGKRKAKDSNKESWTNNVIVSCPRPAPVRHSALTSWHPAISTTETLHPTPCTKCVQMNMDCEKQLGGGACVNCWQTKHKCKYMARLTKKSKLVIESEDEDTASSLHGQRPAVAVALQAIGEVTTASAAPSTTQSKTTGVVISFLISCMH
jgi:hypothetical protein